MKLYKEYFSQPALAYCIGIDHARDFANLCNKEGISAAWVCGETPDGELRDILKKFLRGEIRVLANADLLIEGFDAPRAAVCLNLRPTLSLVLAEQRGGRVLRPFKNKFSTIVDFVYRDESRRARQVTFAAVAQRAFSIPSHAHTTSGASVPYQKKAMPEIEGLKVVVDTDEVMHMTKTLIEATNETAPDDWKMTREWAEELGIPAFRLHDALKRYLDMHPGFRGKAVVGGQAATYLSKNGRIGIHSSPTLIEQVCRELGKPREKKSKPKAEEEELVLRFRTEGSNNTSIQKEFLAAFGWIIDQMIERHFRFVPKSGHDDLRQVGLMSLITFAKKFDLNQKQKFSTIVQLQIWRDMQKAYERSVPILSLPRQEQEAISRIDTLLKKTEGQELEDEKLCEALGMEPEEFRQHMVLRDMLKGESLEQMSDDREERGSDQAICYEEISTPLSELEEKIAYELAVEDVLEHANLTPKQREVLTLYYGLSGEREHTLVKIEEKLGATGASGILAIALAKVERYGEHFEKRVEMSMLRKAHEENRINSEEHTRATQKQKRSTSEEEGYFSLPKDSSIENSIGEEFAERLKSRTFYYAHPESLQYGEYPITTLYELIALLRNNHSSLLPVFFDKEISVITKRLHMCGVWTNQDFAGCIDISLRTLIPFRKAIGEK